jgi:hypothetical protein
MSEDAIVLINNAAPLLCKTTPYYKKALSSLGKTPPYVFTKKINPDPANLSFK